MESIVMLFVLALIALVIAIIVLPIVAMVRASAAFRQVEELRQELSAAKSKMLWLQKQVEALQGRPSSGEAPRPQEQPQPEAEPIQQPAPPASPRTTFPGPEHQTERPEPEIEIQLGPPAREEQPATPWSAPPRVAPAAHHHSVDDAQRSDRIFGGTGLSQTPPAPPSPPRQRRSREDWEMIFGGNLLNRIAAVVLIFGMAYLFKYAIDHQWINPWLRVGIGFIVGGGALLYGNVLYNRRLEMVAQGLLGAGIGVLYLTVYAAFQMYGLIEQTTAFVMMAAVTTVAVIQALRCDSLVISLLGLLGGFLTPLLLSGKLNGLDDPAVGLFIYITMLDAGLLAVTVMKDRWAIIEPMALAGTALTYIFWHGDYFSAAKIPLVIGFLTVFWALFYAADLYRNLKSTPSFPDLRMLVAIANSGLFFGALYFDVNPVHHSWMGIITILVGGAYFSGALAAIRRHVDNPTIVPRYVLTAIAFLVIATSMQFTGYLRAAFWAVEAAALCWAGLKWKMAEAWTPGLILFVLSGIALAYEPTAFYCAGPDSFRTILNLRFLAYAVLAASLGVAAVLFARSDEEEFGAVAEAMHYLWIIALGAAFTVEANDWFVKLVTGWGMKSGHDLFQNTRFAILGAVWMLYSIPIFRMGLCKRLSLAINLGLFSLFGGIVSLAVGSTGFDSELGFVAMLNWRAALLVPAMAIVYVEWRWLRSRRDEYSFAGPLLEVMAVVIALLGLELVTVETLNFFSMRSLWNTSILGASVRSAQPIVLCAVWLVYSLILVGHYLWRRSKAVLGLALILEAVAVCAIVFPATDFESLHRFHILGNLRGAVLLFFIAAVLLQRRVLGSRLDGASWTTTFLGICDFVACGLGFELITVEALDWFWYQTPQTALVLGVDRLTALWLTLGALWTAYALFLVWIGLRKDRPVISACGLASAGLGAVAAGLAGAAMEPARAFTSFLNYRTGVLAWVIAASLILYRWIRRMGVAEWVGDASTAAATLAAVLGGEILTVEIVNHCTLAASGHHLVLGMVPDFARTLMLTAAWAAYSVPLLWISFRARLDPILVLSIGLIAAAAGTAIIAGQFFDPILGFRVVFNGRFGSMAVVAAAMILHHLILAYRKNEYPWIPRVMTGYRAIASLFVFELLTMETWHYYERAALIAPKRAHDLSDARQFALSVVWVLYSIILMVIGIWRRTLSVRIVAIALFYITIAKLFIVDLSFLDTLYRALSFIAVAPILFATSWLYSRYRGFIFGTGEGETEQ